MGPRQIENASEEKMQQSQYKIRNCVTIWFRIAGLNGNAEVIEPHEQAGELDAVDTTTYFRRYDGKR
jgi:hypothetical protein